MTTIRLCSVKKRYARDLLSLLHRWMDWINGQPESEQAERDGWIRLTAKDLAASLGFSRRNYETAHADLKEMGIRTLSKLSHFKITDSSNKRKA